MPDPTHLYASRPLHVCGHNSKTVGGNFPAALLLCLALIWAASTPAATVNVDEDGVGDAMKFVQALAAIEIDADMNGIADIEEEPSTPPMQRSNTNPRISVDSHCPGEDFDGDGIADFVESYGFYRDGLSLRGLERVVSHSQWQAFIDQPPVFGFEVWAIAASALENNFYLLPHPNDNNLLLVDVACARDVITAAYVDAGIPSGSKLLTGTASFNGSVANLMYQLTFHFSPYQPQDAYGNALPVFYTNPTLYSSDRDPYSDRQEALQDFPAGKPKAPANDPLIAAAPAIRAKVVAYRLTEISEDRITYGASDSDLTGTRQTHSSSHSHGVAVAIKEEVEVSPTSPKYKWSVEVKQSNQVSIGSSTTLEQRNTHTTFSQNSDVFSNNCFAKVDLTLDLENLGSARANDIDANINLYLGDKLWQTIAVSDALASLPSLSPSEHIRFNTLGQGTEESCLTLAQTNYLSGGGYIVAETLVAAAKIPVFNPDTGVIESSGNWQDHLDIIENELARVDLNLSTTTGASMEDSLFIVASTLAYPRVGLSIADALEKTFSKVDCTTVNDQAQWCYQLIDEFIALGADATVDFLFYGDDGHLLDREASHALYQNLQPSQSTSPLEKILAPRMTASVVEGRFSSPHFAHVEAIQQSNALAAFNAPADAKIRSLVQDFYGIDQVYFCRDENTSNCLAMEATAVNADHPLSGQYEISLAGYQLSGHEYLKAVSINGNESVAMLEDYFFSLGSDQARQLSQFLDSIDRYTQDLETLVAMAGTPDSDYQNWINAGLIADINDSNSLLDHYRSLAAQATQACAYVHSTSININDLSDTMASCQKQLDKLKQVIESEPAQIYDPQNLPRRHIYERDWGWSEAITTRGSTHCGVGPHQFIVGIDMGKKKAAAEPSIWLRYVSFDPFTKTLSDVSEKRCGPSSGREKHFSPPALSADVLPTQAWLVLDVGASVGGSKITDMDNGDVERLCVSYRKFDFQQGEFISGKKIDCNGDSRLQEVEADTGRLQKNNQSSPLRIIEASASNSAITLMKGRHVYLGNEYPPAAMHNIHAGGQYRLLSHDGRALSLAGNTQNGRSVVLTQPVQDEAQIWIAEAINNREFWLRPKNFDGYLSRIDANKIMVTPSKDPQTEDAYLQRFRIKLVPSSQWEFTDWHSIGAEADGRLLSVDGNEIKLASPDSGSEQQWIFEAIEPRSAPLHRLKPDQRLPASNVDITYDAYESGKDGIALFQQNHAFIEWEMAVNAKATYDLQLRYWAQAGSQHTLTITVDNSQVASLSLPGHGVYENYSLPLLLEIPGQYIVRVQVADADASSPFLLDHLSYGQGNTLYADQAELCNGRQLQTQTGAEVQAFIGAGFTHFEQDGDCARWQADIAQPGHYVGYLAYTGHAQGLTLYLNGEPLADVDLPPSDAVENSDWSHYLFEVNLPTAIGAELELRATGTSALNLNTLSLIHFSPRRELPQFSQAARDRVNIVSPSNKCLNFDLGEEYFVSAVEFSFNAASYFSEHTLYVNGENQALVYRTIGEENLPGYLHRVELDSIALTDRLEICGSAVMWQEHDMQVKKIMIDGYSTH